jgi:RNA polymerase sigma factor (sigma-70 family)
MSAIVHLLIVSAPLVSFSCPGHPMLFKGPMIRFLAGSTQDPDGGGNYPGAMTVIDLSSRPDADPFDWAAALDQNGRWLRTVVSARLGERQAVDEVMQEISLAAVEQRSPLADPTKVAAWLYRLAVIKVLLYRRQRGRQAKLVGRYAERSRSDPDQAGSGPLGWLIAEERGEIVRLALARMPRREAELLLLKYSENWTYRELAAHLGQTEAAVESRLHRARRRLREALAHHEEILGTDPC